ncbi:hypothetical protein NDU88_002663 [Pleurodeles waltl]|uniref:Uncharacterized protein n=1 Tax=Pleurodeles waltl TaxID=8319 RepID=A0AAV7UZ52_PLEWA|nr:hypothetical protein NDU88_002663 [Pleurodeles waltl]
MWHLNAWFLQDEHLVDRLLQEIDSYFEKNEGTAQSKVTLWAACQATVRDHAKALLRRQERNKQTHITSLEACALQLKTSPVWIEHCGVEHALAMEQGRHRMALKHAAQAPQFHLSLHYSGT